MRTNPLRIDLDELQMALTWRTDDGGHYLDLTTGEVVAFTGLDDDLAEAEIESGLAQDRLIPIESLPSSVEHAWMAMFAASVVDPTLRRLLEVALGASGAFRRFKGVLTRYPAERKRWFGFRAQRLRGAAREWLRDNEIEATTHPLRRESSS